MLDEETTQLAFSSFDIDMLEACVEVLFFTARADGFVDDREREAFERLVSEVTHGEVGPEALRRVFAHLERRPVPDQRAGRLRQIAARLEDPRHRRGVLALAAEVAAVDGKLTDDERAFLAEVAAAFEVPDSELDALIVARARGV